MTIMNAYVSRRASAITEIKLSADLHIFYPLGVSTRDQYQKAEMLGCTHGATYSNDEYPPLRLVLEMSRPSG
jgi:hypothetical protein